MRDLHADPRPAAVVLDMSRLARVTSTVLDGLRDLENELGANGFEVRYAALREPVRTTARRWPWRHEVESQGRHFDTVEDAAARE